MHAFLSPYVSPSLPFSLSHTHIYLALTSLSMAVCTDFSQFIVYAAVSNLFSALFSRYFSIHITHWQQARKKANGTQTFNAVLGQIKKGEERPAPKKLKMHQMQIYFPQNTYRLRPITDDTPFIDIVISGSVQFVRELSHRICTVCLVATTKLLLFRCAQHCCSVVIVM